MSVLKGLKGTIKGVQQDIVDGLKALTSFETHPKSETLKRLRGDGICLDAGADLLQRYHLSWIEIDSFTKQSAKKAEIIDKEIFTVFKKWEKEAEVMRNLEDSIKELPELLQVIEQLTEKLVVLKNDFTRVEEAMERLEDVCDEEEIQKQITLHNKQLLQYKQQKQQDAERVKVELARNHARRMQELEKNRNEKLQERHEAFDEAFSSDLSFYKQHGRTEKLSLPEISKVSSLSDINIEQDDGALDDFLASQTTTPITDIKPEVADAEDKGAELGEEEEMFFEDDYTKDYRNNEGKLEEDLENLKIKFDQEDSSYRTTFDTGSTEEDHVITTNDNRSNSNINHDTQDGSQSDDNTRQSSLLNKSDSVVQSDSSSNSETKNIESCDENINQRSSEDNSKVSTENDT
ncbi:hypothetical protein SNE40_017852 [Patella caerulea]|uniref:Dysbindin n=1 Tax=Patella caerulea TaxID=87958 RepID=A0AAN8PAH3_PATCE